MGHKAEITERTQLERKAEARVRFALATDGVVIRLG
jgi:hypothetical protein